ncbi:MAG: TetR/AcrR family transcriptional regulator [Gorillibacterium sp.]|nr:TetR/AcrR family transcriptional regulator [Gorillibacterium sp.]
MSPKVSDTYKEERSAAILEVALQCFAEKGYRSATIDDIARKLGMSKGSIYLYFKTKEEIYTRIIQDRMRRTVKGIRSQYTDIEGAADKLHLVIQTFCDQNLEGLRFLLAFHLEFWLESSRRPELREVMEEQNETAITLLRDIVEEGIRTGEFRADVCPEQAASLFWAARDGLALQFVGGGKESDYRERMEGMEKMLLRYLVKI